MSSAEPAPQRLSNEATIARVLFFVGAGYAGFIILFFFGYTLLFMGVMMDGMGFTGAPPFAFMPFAMFLVFGALAVVGGILNLVAAGRTRTDPRSAGIVGIVASVLPPVNFFSLAAAVLIMLSPEGKAAAAQAA